VTGVNMVSLPNYYFFTTHPTKIHMYIFFFQEKKKETKKKKMNTFT